MRMLHAAGAAVALAVLAIAPAGAQQAFDACEVFTQADAESALGTAAAAEQANPRARRPKVVTSCAYDGFKDGKAVEARAQFRFARSDDEARRAFDDARLKLQTKPLLLPGAEAFWSGGTGQMHLRKGRTWVTLSVGPAKHSERDADQARKLAELLAAKL